MPPKKAAGKKAGAPKPKPGAKKSKKRTPPKQPMPPADVARRPSADGVRVARRPSADGVRVARRPSAEAVRVGSSKQLKSNGTPGTKSGATQVELSINGRAFSVDLASDPTLTPRTSLNEFIRTRTPFTGTKRSCGEGGCGACVVMLTTRDGGCMPVNSCLTPLLGTNGCAVTTTEGIGADPRTKATYSAVQDALAANAGTQCGFCSPGFVMSMYSFLQSKPQGAPITEAEIEKALEGNLCRCTGYRPILEAFKSFATEAPTAGDREKLKREAVMPQVTTQPLPPHRPPGTVPAADVVLPGKRAGAPLQVAGGGATWVEVRTEAALQEALAAHVGARDVMLVAGNTSQGIYKGRRPDVLINIAPVKALRTCSAGAGGVTIGAGASYARAIAFLRHPPPYPAAADPGALSTTRAHLAAVADHLEFGPSPSLRSTATVGGNVMLVNEHHQKGDNFPSDAFVVLVGVGAEIAVVDSQGAATSIKAGAFPAHNMAGKYIRSFTIPWAVEGQVFRSYKTALRSRFSKAVVHSAMSCVVKDGTIQPGTARVVFGSVSDAAAKRQKDTEKLIEGTAVTDEAVFRSACAKLSSALTPEPDQAPGWGEYRKSLVLSQFYKYYLALQPDVSPALQSALPPWLDRPVTTASRAYDHDAHKDKRPIGEPGKPKYDGWRQCTGEAEFVDDLDVPSGTLHACPVRARHIGAFAVDTKPVEGMPGFHRFVCATDVPTAACPAPLNFTWSGPIFAQCMVSGALKSAWIDQVIGICIADTAQHALDCARVLSDRGVTWSDTKEQLCLTIADAREQGSFLTQFLDLNRQVVDGTPEKPWKYQHPKDLGDADPTAGSARVAKGTLSMGGMWHFHMEPLACLTIPKKEGGVEVHPTCQGGPICQNFLQVCTGFALGDIDVQIGRLGGGFGGKGTPAVWLAAAATMGSLICRRPLKILMDIEDNMSAMGGRPPWEFEYTVGFEADGKINGVKADIYVDTGAWGMPTVDSPAGPGMSPDSVAIATGPFVQNFDGCYNIQKYDLSVMFCKTDHPPGTFTRAPGWLPGSYLPESIVNTVAKELGVPTNAVRERNFYQKGDHPPSHSAHLPLTDWTVDVIWPMLKESADYDRRAAEVAEFNAANKWVKKGIAMQPIKYAVAYDFWLAGFDMHINISCDGTVNVISGGTEMGQGLHTKLAQMVAYRLGCPFDAVRNHRASTHMIVNFAFPFFDNVTSGAVGSELCCMAADKCVKILEPRINGVREAMGLGPDVPWAKVAKACHDAGVNMGAKSISEPYSAADLARFMGEVQAGKPPSAPPPKDFIRAYNSQAGAVAEVTLDALTGEVTTTRVDIVFDCGKSLNPEIDVGQVEGAFTMGLGFVLNEDIRRRPDGALETNNSWNYKIPIVHDTPREFNVSLLPDNPNADGGVLSSKCCGEPPICLTYSLVEATAAAISAARKEGGGADAPPFEPNVVPLSIEKRQLGCRTSADAFTLK